MPDDAYRFEPARNILKPLIFFLLDTDTMFVCDKYIQRLIFYGGQPWEQWEQEHLDKFT